MAEDNSIDDKVDVLKTELPKESWFTRGFGFTATDSRLYKSSMVILMGMACLFGALAAGGFIYHKVYNKYLNMTQPAIELADVTVLKEDIYHSELTGSGPEGGTVTLKNIDTPYIEVSGYKGRLCGNLVNKLRKGDVLESIKFYPGEELYGSCHEIIGYERTETTTTR